MSNSTIFDDVLRTIQERMPKLLIPLVNEVFGTSYAMDTEVICLPEGYQKLVSKVVADSCSKLGEQIYHFECQSTKDGGMILRMVEYDFMIAMAEYISSGETRKLKFPKSCIIYLRTSKNTLSEEQLEVEFADGQTEYVKIIQKLQEILQYSEETEFRDLLQLMRRITDYLLRKEPELRKGCVD